MTPLEPEWWAGIVAKLRLPGTRREAVRDLYATVGPRIRHFFEGKGLSPDEAEDQMQEVFIRVLRGLDDFRGEAGQFPAWMWRIAHNLFNDVYRSRREMVSIDGDEEDEEAPLVLVEPGEGPAGAVERGSVIECVRRGFRQFLERYPDRAQCLAWLATDHLDIPAIAELLGRTAGATRQYLLECRKKLKPLIEHCYVQDA